MIFKTEIAGTIKTILGGLELFGFLMGIILAIAFINDARQGFNETATGFEVLFGWGYGLLTAIMFIALVFFGTVCLTLGIIDLLCGIFSLKKKLPTAAMVLTCINEFFMLCGFWTLVSNEIDTSSSFDTNYVIILVGLLIFAGETFLNVYTFIANFREKKLATQSKFYAQQILTNHEQGFTTDRLN